MLRKYDIVVIVIFLLLALLLFYFNYTKGEGTILKVYVNNKEVLSKSLIEIKDGDRFEVKGPLGISIFEYVKGKGVHMISSPCPDKLCVKQGFINKKEESIICLPNKIIITLEAKE
ncbi:NusG domain II-containing protein [Dictyoglomus thermophilum]|uniref:Uncharacterized protein n=1 Tax=Dictyoglomus thermophilum (strain ATCC 35947 / DSM 3960 / H-6-12) TaxID=309799 RepID=B5YA55_DICT6|nr:NusG domain II-containing protein [Dictyoglomus thermophilum]ACI18863.1 conserved hypothetical protein [Dictyoglomus thermophilum H-6-12]